MLETLADVLVDASNIAQTNKHNKILSLMYNHSTQMQVCKLFNTLLQHFGNKIVYGSIHLKLVNSLW